MLYNSGSNRARNFNSASLNCTLLRPITITYYLGINRNRVFHSLSSPYCPRWGMGPRVFHWYGIYSNVLYFRVSNWTARGIYPNKHTLNPIPGGLSSYTTNFMERLTSEWKYIPGVDTLVPDNLTQNDTVNSDIPGMSVSKSIIFGPVSSFPLISKVSEKSTKKIN